MSAAVDTMKGTTLVGATSAWTAEKLSLAFSGIERDAIPTTHLGTTVANGSTEVGGKTYMADAIEEPGSLEIEGHYNPDTLPPTGKVAESWTVQMPASGGDSTGAKAVFSGFFTSFPISGIAVGEKATFSATLKISGVITFTAGS